MKRNQSRSTSCRGRRGIASQAASSDSSGSATRPSGMARLTALAVVVVGAVLTGWLTLDPTTPALQAQTRVERATAYEPMSETDFLRLQQLREDLALTQLDLAAMGLDRTGAEAALARLRSWYEANKGRLDEARHAEGLAEAKLHRAQREIHLGRADAATTRSIPLLRDALLKAKASHSRVCLEAAETCVAQTSITARERWAAARANAGRTLAMRFVPELEAEVRTTDRMSYSQKQANEAAWASARVRMDDVAAAEMAVLPLPETMRPLGSIRSESTVDRDP